MANLHALRLDLISGNNHKRHLEPSLVEEQAGKCASGSMGGVTVIGTWGLPSSGRSQSRQPQGEHRVPLGNASWVQEESLLSSSLAYGRLLQPDLTLSLPTAPFPEFSHALES